MFCDRSVSDRSLVSRKMRRRFLEHSARSAVFLSAIALQATLVLAQSQAMDGQIEGLVWDQNRRAVVSAHVTAQNLATGVTRRATTNDDGSFRFLLLSPGSYRVTTEAEGFKSAIQEGITLATGQTAVVNILLEVGTVREILSVSTDASVVDPGKIELGRVMNSNEVQALPLINLNPYNFVFLQSNVTGNRTAVPGLGFPNVNANGFSRRGNYQIDGNYSTDVMAGGTRLLFLSRTYIQEVQLLTNGMSAEYGATVGHVMNAVSPSGSNFLHGSVGYQFRRRGFSAQRFNAEPGEPKHEATSDALNASLGGPLVTDRWHFYAGFEAFRWDLASAARTITISAADRAALTMYGVPAAAMPNTYTAPETYGFFIGRTDAVLNNANRLALRYLHSTGRSEKIGASQLNTLQVSRDNHLLHRSLAGQLISNIGAKVFNEFRVQQSYRDASSEPNELTGTGDVTIRISNVATFGAPLDSFSNFENRKLTTLQNNLSIVMGAHVLKIGGGFTVHDATQPSQPSAIYQFSSIERYVAAVTGNDRRSYTRYTDTFGDPTAETNAVYWNGFVQGDWRINDRLKLNTGLRYDVFLLPDADPTAAFVPSRNFRVDKNNFGPRAGLAYQVDSGDLPAVIRVSAGLYYDPPILNYYLRALRTNGNPRSFSFNFGPIATPTTQAGPEFPNRFQSFPAGQAAPVRIIFAVSPTFRTMTAFHSNFQYEKALSSNISATASYSFSRGWHIPTSRNINCTPTGRALADGRPVYGQTFVDSAGNVTVVSCVQRIIPEFSAVWNLESVGNLTYHAIALKLSKRLSSRIQFSLNYTLARSTDDAAEENITASAQMQSDPSNRRTDRSRSLSDQTHTLAATLVGRPRFDLKNRFLNSIFNNNQLAMIVRASDGERYNVVTDTDLNGDGAFMDRPVGIPRNALQTPAFFNADIRVSRTIDFFSERHHLELFADIINITNTNSIIGFGNTIVTANNANTALVNPFTGELRGALPRFRDLGVISNDSRRMQLGVRWSF